MGPTIDFAAQLARDAGKILLSYFNPRGINSSLKKDHTVVTEADLASNDYICKSIKQEFPKDGILTEEGNTIFPETKYVWIIDPLDGTTNFSLGLHYWGVSISRFKDGFPELTAQFFPLINELFTGELGLGSTLNGQKLKVNQLKINSPSSFFACCSRTHKYYDIKIPYKTRILGSATYGLSTVAKGSAKLAFEVTPKIWDFAGSWLITKEAGGVIGTLNNYEPFPLLPGTDYLSVSYPILVGVSMDEWMFGKSKIKKKP
jgi:myo-inositol-1(or 4)-monophosphatase